VARRLVTLVHGLGAHSALDPDHWSPADQRRVLADELSSLGHRAPPPRKHAGLAGDAATRRLRKEILAAIKQGPDPAARRRRRPF